MSQQPLCFLSMRYSVIDEKPSTQSITVQRNKHMQKKLVYTAW